MDEGFACIGVIEGNVGEVTKERDLLQTKKESEFRNYKNSERQDIVTMTYLQHHKNQTMDFVKEMKKQHLNFNKAKMTIWEAIRLLDDLIDDSDPDADFPQIYHALQTAEELRREWPQHDWMHLVGLIHDLGKVLALPQFGESPQWAVVGDTFPVGCQFSRKIVRSDLLVENKDFSDSRYNTEYGIYEPHCGLDKLEMTWGHDEYMYQLCVHNKSTLPREGLMMIRYHSFYPWHREGEYYHLMNEEDHVTLQWVQRFNRGDLYSKSSSQPDVASLKPYYESLIHKYFPNPIIEW